MPLTNFIAPEITDSYLKGLTQDQLIDLLHHKTNGLLVASRLNMGNTATAQHLQQDIKKIHERILEQRTPPSE
jgi:hypothetical protein